MSHQSRRGSTIELPADAIITPAAQDWLRATRLDVRRNGAGVSPREADAAVFLIGDARSPILQVLLPTLERTHDGLAFLPCQGHLAGCLDAVRRMCEGLARCGRARGVVVVRAGAIVNCVANRHQKVRAAILTKPSDLYGLQKELGINVLILEPERLSLRQMQATIDAFLQGGSTVHPLVESALSGADPKGTGCLSCSGAK